MGLWYAGRMRRATLFLIVLAACGGGDDAKPTTYQHADPKFAIDVPGGYKVGEVREDHGAFTLDIDEPRSAYSLSVAWSPARQTAAEELASYKQTLEATDKRSKIVGEGELPGGGGWIETDRMTSTVQAWLRVGDTMIRCSTSAGGLSSAPAALVGACKSLRPGE